MNKVLLAFGVLILMIRPGYGVTDEDRREFDSQYGGRIKKVKASRGRADDIDLAKELLGVARESTNEVGMMVLMCEGAWGLAKQDRNACDVAAAAMRLVAAHDSKLRSGALEKAAHAQRIFFASRQDEDSRSSAGRRLVDDVLLLGERKLKERDLTGAGRYGREGMRVAKLIHDVTRMNRVMVLNETVRRRTSGKQRAELILKRLKAQPNNKKTIRELVLCYLVEVEDAAKAKVYSPLLGDKKLDVIIGIVGKLEGGLGLRDKKTLGLWYQSVIPEIPAVVRKGIIRRAIGFLEAFVEGSMNELEKVKARWAIKKLRVLSGDLKRDLLLHYTFDRVTAGGTKVRDVSVRGKHGTTKQKIRLVRGKIGEAILLEQDDRVNAGKGVVLRSKDAFSFGGWFYLKDMERNVGVSRMSENGRHQGWDLYFRGSTIQIHLIHRWSGDAKKLDAIRVTSGNVLRKNVWFHAFVTYNGSKKASGLKVYLNGKPVVYEEVIDQLKGEINDPDNRLILGRRGTHDHWLNGMIDDLRVYGRVLSEAEIRALVSLGEEK